MSGHSKWAKIKRQKAGEDAKKSKIFSMYSRIITIESKKARGDKNSPGLRTAIERAKSNNVPNDTIERAVAKGTGAGAENFEEVMYEAFGPGGVAIIIEGVTDNKNRTTPEIKHLLAETGGTLGTQGSAAWAFKKDGGQWLPIAPLAISDGEKEKVANLIEALEDHDDIKNIFTNADFGPEE